MRKVSTRIGPKGQLVIPKELREKHGMTAGATVFFEDREGAVEILAPVRLTEVCGTFQVDLKQVKRELKKERSEW